MKTISVLSITKGLTKIKLRIFNIEKEIDVFIVENEDFHDFLIGLDTIKEFRLRQNENLIISQREDIVEINFNEHINENDWRTDLDHLDDKKKLKIKQLIEEYKAIFAKDKYDIGTIKDYEARIDLIVDKFCSKRPYRCTIEDRKEIEQQVAKLLKNDLIEESYSPFSAPVTLALKKGEGKTRLCIDFRDLNKNVIPQAQPFPLIDDLIIKARNCKYFTSLDINSVFWSIPLRVEDKNKTGFITQEGHYQ